MVVTAYHVLDVSVGYVSMKVCLCHASLFLWPRQSKLDGDGTMLK